MLQMYNAQSTLTIHMRGINPEYEYEDQFIKFNDRLYKLCIIKDSYEALIDSLNWPAQI